MDLDDVFLHKLTPQETIATIEDLTHDNQLSRSLASVLEEQILVQAGADEAWGPEHLTCRSDDDATRPRRDHDHS